ncbi:MAG: exodeoxyribonuclease V subunit gamma, partial [Deltaproteobacteria bacterium]|nr:exodeoxyribonuclease V subunit gamma [Deltaproteobacteria bacterium]
GAFPVARTRRAWDPFSQPKPGELDPRLAQRHLLLETLLSARERLLFFWNGFGSKPGEDYAPAVPVVEFRDLLVEASGLPVRQWVTEHPLQPWSPRTFRDGRFTYDAAMAEAATTLQNIQAGRSPPQPIGLAATRPQDCLPEANPPASIAIDDLVRGLTRASDMFLRDRLQVAPARDSAQLLDREPLELSGLDRWGVRDEVLRTLLERGDGGAEVPDQVARRLQAEGRLPLQAGGRRIIQQACATATELLSSYDQVQGEPRPPGPPLRAEVTLAGGGAVRTVRVQGPDLAARQLGDATLLEWLSPSRSDSSKALMRTWVYLLVARASGRPATAARVVGHGDAPSGGSRGRAGQVAGVVLATSAEPGEAARLLGDLVAVWQACRDRPLPLFAKASWAWAQSAGAPLAKRRAALRAKWQGSDERDPGDTSDGAVHSLFAGWEPVDHLDPAEGPESFAGLAERVYGPLLAALAEGPAAAAPFFAPAAADAEEAA